LPVFKLVELPFCKVIQIDPWNSPAHRYFIAYRAQETFRQVMGLSVIDEYATFSSPLFFASTKILGKIYDAGISLGHLRDPEMGLDLGWPPLCVGIEEPEPKLSENWQGELLDQIKQNPGDAKSEGVKETLVDGHQIQKVRIANIDIYATDAPLLPKQLKRICQLGSNPFSLAFSVGNKITPQKDAAPISVQALSELSLKGILEAFSK
jgi:hypothetical protein